MGLLTLFANGEGRVCKREARPCEPRACGKFTTVFRERHEMDQQQPVQGQVQIKADEKELQGQYSNLVMIHHELYLHFPKRRARKTAEQHDPQPRSRETHLARDGRESCALRSAVWNYQGVTRGKHARAQRRFCAIGAEFFAPSVPRRCWCRARTRPPVRILKLFLDVGL